MTGPVTFQVLGVPTPQGNKTAYIVGGKARLVEGRNAKAREEFRSWRGSIATADPARIVDDCGFRMLEPHEIAAAMAFPPSYIPHELPKRDRVRLAGNAVTPPVMTWTVGRVAQALEAA